VREVRGIIQAERLDLIPMSPEFLAVSLQADRVRAAELIGLTIPDDWPDIPDVVRLRLSQLQADASMQPWLLRAIGLRSSGAMVGHIGFHTQPGAQYLESLAPGGVEFGYTVFPRFRRQGYAREACEALMEWALQTHGVTRFVVSISPTNAASLALAAHMGFRRIGSHLDAVDGPEDIFERRFDACAPTGSG
jgi:[ribosomal protein S5]-alanine N-acetyltransferase